MGSLPSFRLDGQTALVTGAARGLGRAIALALAEAGADVALGLRDVKQDGGVVFRDRGARTKAMPCRWRWAPRAGPSGDFRGPAQLGKLDILVNNTGVAPTNLALDVREEDFDRTLNINLKGTFFACQARAR